MRQTTLASFSLASAYGSVKPSRNPEDFEEITRRAKEGKADGILGKLTPIRSKGARISDDEAETDSKPPYDLN